MKSLNQIVIVLAVTFLFSSCASSSKNMDQVIDARLKSTPEVESYAAFGKDARKRIKESDLTADQKSRMLKLQRETQDQSNELREESLKLRVLLIQDLSGKNYNADEVEAIKARLRKVEDRRLDLVYSAVDKASAILGHDKMEQNANIIRTFDFEGRGQE